MIDHFRKMLNQFAWTWLECKVCSFHKKPRRKERMATRLARAYAKRQTKRDIDDSLA